MRNVDGPASACRALSVVSTLYHSSPFLDEFLDRALEAAQAIALDFEIVLVDDGSPDDSLTKAIRRAQVDDRIKVIELARNFGHHAAILTGLALADGERVFLVDSDLEEVPELLIEFSRVMDSSGVDVVYGVHDQIAGTRFRRWTSGGFWKIFNMLSDTKTDENICHVRLMKRDYVQALMLMPERNIFLGGLYAWPGYKQLPVKIDRQLRRKRSTYDFRKRVDLLVRSVVAFSTRPLQLVFGLGMSIAGLSTGVALFFFIYRLSIGRRMVTGYASIVISIWFLSGLIIMSLGIIGLYLGQVYIETKGRPRALVRRIHDFASKDEAGE